MFIAPDICYSRTAKNKSIMANFYDLPKSVREHIYALHLERDEPITGRNHLDIIKQHRGYDTFEGMPSLLRVSDTIEEEAMSFYYANNHFVFDDPGDLHHMTQKTWRRHLRLVRKVTFTWGVDTILATDMYFKSLAKFKCLQELYIRVDETAMLRKMLRRSKAHPHARIDNPTPQQQLAMLRFPGLVGLLRVTGVPHVRFIKLVNSRGEESGGPIPGGVLETQVAAKMQTSKVGCSPPK